MHVLPLVLSVLWLVLFAGGWMDGWRINWVFHFSLYFVGIKIMDISTYEHIYKLSLTFMGFKIDVKLGSWDFIFKIQIGIRVFFIFILKLLLLKNSGDNRQFLDLEPTVFRLFF